MMLVDSFHSRYAKCPFPKKISNFHQVGLPAKSGVSGAMIVVVPNVLGLCLYSPPLDNMGNTVRGVNFCKVSKITRFEHYQISFEPSFIRNKISKNHFIVFNALYSNKF